MRIVFFGSSHGVPEANRKCSCALIEVGENRYFIDMGSNPVEQLSTRGIPVTSIKSVFITHMHGDHANGLIPFIDLCSWYYKTADPDIFLPKETNKIVPIMKKWIACNGVEMRDFRFHTVSEGQVWDDGVIKVTAFRTKHIDYSYAYLVEGDNKRVLFSGDLCHKGPENDFPVSVLDKPLDLAICESAHFSAEKYLPIFEGCDNLKSVCFNHINNSQAATPYAVKKALDIPVILATDGREINL